MNMWLEKIRWKFTLVVGVSLALIFLFSNEVWAKSCYVDDGGDVHGDGSKGKPYKTIGRALDGNCDNIKLQKGIYNEKVILGKNVKLKGKGSDSIITQKIKLKNGASLEGVYIKGGVEVVKNANVSLRNVKITGARIGINTVGSGRLRVYDCKITGNRKGLYLQYGKNVDIRNSEVVDNKEEGVDIRANVDGIIKNNNISYNKEGGIEVIAGKSDLIIANNTIKNNTASGIAVQFYKENKDFGKLQIMGNILKGNGNYGIDCKIPSGGNPSWDYWSKSVQFKYNKISDNRKGVISTNCHFTKKDILNATKTETEIRELEKERRDQEQNRLQERKEQEQKEEEQKRKIEEEKRRVAQQERDWQIKKQVEEIIQNDLIRFDELSNEYKQKFQSRGKIKSFLFGVDPELIEDFKKSLDNFRQKIEEAAGDLEKIKSPELRKTLNDKIDVYRQQYNKEMDLYWSFRNKFGLIPWFKSLFK